MSKAFTKDEGEAAGDAPSHPQGAPLPSGARNYVTPAGAAALRSNLVEAQSDVEKLKAQGGNAFLAARDRLTFLQQRLEAMEVVTPPPTPDERVRFGATVELEDEDGARRTVRIVGVDEADARVGDVSWTSPLARALLGHQAGDAIELRAPKGVTHLEILGVRSG